MKYSVTLFCIIAIIGCDSSSADNAVVDHQFISYLDINIDSLGRLPTNPYIVEAEENGKHIIVVGTQHSRDTLNPMFLSIEQLFYDLAPTVAINEGGTSTDSYLNRNNAIQKDGELGLLKFLCDGSKINMINGDAQEKEEFGGLSKTFSREEALFFFASERFVLPFKQWGKKNSIDSLYKSDFIDGYMKSCGIELSDEESSFEHYRELHKEYFNKEFDLEDMNSDDFATISSEPHFSKVARRSCEFRDRHLLSLIENNLKTHDRIIIVFGGWHVLAIEPAIAQIMNRTKNGM